MVLHGSLLRIVNATLFHRLIFSPLWFSELALRIYSFQSNQSCMTVLVKLLHFIFKKHAIKLPEKPDMMTVVTQNVALMIFVHSFKLQICQINSAFNLIRFVHIFTAVLCFLYWQINILWLVTFQHISRILNIVPRRGECEVRTATHRRLSKCMYQYIPISCYAFFKENYGGIFLSSLVR